MVEDVFGEILASAWADTRFTSLSAKRNADVVVRHLWELLGPPEEWKHVTGGPLCGFAQGLANAGHTATTIATYTTMARDLMVEARRRGADIPDPGQFKVAALARGLIAGLQAVPVDTLDRAVIYLTGVPSPFNAILGLVMTTGLSAHHLRDLRMEDIRLDEGRPRLWARGYRDKEGLLVPILTPGARLLGQHLRQRRPHTLVFPGLRQRAVLRIWQPLHQTLGFLRGANPAFDLRRIYLRQLVEAGLRDFECGIMLGQRSDMPVDVAELRQRIEFYDDQRRQNDAGTQRSSGLG